MEASQAWLRASPRVCFLQRASPRAQSWQARSWQAPALAQPSAQSWVRPWARPSQVRPSAALPDGGGPSSRASASVQDAPPPRQQATARPQASPHPAWHLDSLPSVVPAAWHCGPGACQARPELAQHRHRASRPPAGVAGGRVALPPAAQHRAWHRPGLASARSRAHGPDASGYPRQGGGRPPRWTRHKRPSTPPYLYLWCSAGAGRSAAHRAPRSSTARADFYGRRHSRLRKSGRVTFRLQDFGPVPGLPRS